MTHEPVGAGSDELTGFGATGVQPDSVGTAIGVVVSETTTVQSAGHEARLGDREVALKVGPDAGQSERLCDHEHVGLRPRSRDLQVAALERRLGDGQGKAVCGQDESAAKAATMMKLRTEFPPEHPLLRAMFNGTDYSNSPGEYRSPRTPPAGAATASMAGRRGVEHNMIPLRLLKQTRELHQRGHFVDAGQR